MSGPGTKVVSIPVKFDPRIKTLSEVPIRKQLELAALLQNVWADNQVSCTISFDPETEGPLLEPLLNEYQHKLKGVSFLPNIKEGAYPQMPYEAISDEQYADLMKNLKPLDFKKMNSDPEKAVGCDNDKCQL